MLRLALLALAMAPSAFAWIASRSPSELDTFGSHGFTSVDNERQPIMAEQPGCETIHVIYSAGPFPLGVELWVTLITDPEHDKNPTATQVGKGCVNCPNGCCQDIYERTSWTFLNSTFGQGVSDNFCVPKGFNIEDDTACSADWAITEGDKTRNFCQNRTLACPDNDFMCDPALISTDCPAADQRHVNPDCKQHDCHFGHEVFVTNVRPTSCTVVPFGLGQHELTVDGTPIIDQHWTVTIAGDDADVPPEGLTVMYRAHVRDCTAWNANVAQYEATKVVESCAAYHAMSNCQLDDLAPSSHSSDSPFWIDPNFGIAHHCAGHLQPECSAKHFKGNTEDMPLKNHCRVIGCWPAESPNNGRTCDFCDLMLSTNYPMNATITTPTMENDCNTQADKDHFTVMFYSNGFPSGTSSDVLSPPNKCCDTLAHEDPPTDPPTPEPTPPSTNSGSTGSGSTGSSGTGSSGTGQQTVTQGVTQPTTRPRITQNSASSAAVSSVALAAALVVAVRRTL